MEICRLYRNVVQGLWPLLYVDNWGLPVIMLKLVLDLITGVRTLPSATRMQYTLKKTTINFIVLHVGRLL
jgi:hypothetical protein